MMTRELHPGEWAKFFDCFSRRFRGRRMTLGVTDAGGDAPLGTLADRLPLLGISMEPTRGPAEVIEVMLGDAPAQHVAHAIRRPSRVRVAQVSSGEDEVLLIDCEAGPTTRVDFRPITKLDTPAAEPAAEPVAEPAPRSAEPARP
jgi:hypothetical protein